MAAAAVDTLTQATGPRLAANTLRGSQRPHRLCHSSRHGCPPACELVVRKGKGEKVNLTLVCGWTATTTAVAAMTTTATQQFALLFQDFLDSFSYSASKGGNSRPDVGDKGAEYRSFLVRCFGGWWMLRGCGHNSLGPCTPCMESARAHALAPACVRAWRDTVDGLQSHHFGALRGVQSPAPPRT